MIDDVLKMIGLITICQNPEKYKSIIDLYSDLESQQNKHGYYMERTGEKYEGKVYIHGNGSPFTDGHGNIVKWR